MVLRHAMASPPNEAPLMLGVVLSRIAAELASASDHVKVVQDTMEDLAGDDLSAAGMVCLQNLDLVEQTVRALGEIVASMSALTIAAQDVPGEVLATCKLSALADRLAGITRAEETDFELF